MLVCQLPASNQRYEEAQVGGLSPTTAHHPIPFDHLGQKRVEEIVKTIGVLLCESEGNLETQFLELAQVALFPQTLSHLPASSS